MSTSSDHPTNAESMAREADDAVGESAAAEKAQQQERLEETADTAGATDERDHAGEGDTTG